MSDATSITARRLGVVSDTHGHVANARAAARMLESMEVDVVLHCGDIGTVEVVRCFGAWPTHFVFGNVDYAEEDLRAAMEQAGQNCHGRFGELVLGERKIAWLHGDDETRLEQTRSDARWHLVCSGHTHRALVERRDDRLILNPGALYRAQPHTLAVVELDTLEAMIVPV